MNNFLHELKHCRVTCAALACLVVAWLHPNTALQAQPAGFRVVLSLPVSDTVAHYAVALSRDVVLNVRRAVDAHGLHMGWDLSAVDQRARRSPNFFYECLCGHGPRPHDYYAWHFVTSYYPSERDLPVFGYPLEVRVRCLDCEVAGKDGTDAHFLRGTFELSVRRLTRSNPEQRPGLSRNKTLSPRQSA